MSSSSYIKAVPRTYVGKPMTNTYIDLFKQVPARPKQVIGRTRPLLMAKSLFDPSPKDEDPIARFDWIGKSKKEQEELYDLKKPEEKE